MNIEARESGRNGERREERHAGSKGYTRLFINLGAVDEFSRGDMLGFICNNAKISGKSIGKIDMKGVFTFFEVQDADVERVFQGFQDVDFNGRTVRIEVSGDRKAREDTAKVVVEEEAAIEDAVDVVLKEEVLTDATVETEAASGTFQANAKSPKADISRRYYTPIEKAFKSI